MGTRARPGCWIVLALVAAAAVFPLLAPGALGIDVDLEGFSTDRALAHVATIASQPHPMGSPALARVRAYLVERLASYGLEVDEQVFEAPDYYDASEVPVEAMNVLGRLRGRASTGALLLVAHYDTVPTTPGANDDSAAVAVLLEAARVLSERSPPGNDLIFLFTDGEEPAPKYGASTFVDGHPWFDDVAFVVNLEAPGSCGASLLVEANGAEGWLIEALVEASPAPAAWSFATETASLMGKIGTDFDVFKERGRPGLQLAYIRGSPIYHTPDDDLASLGASSLGHHGAHVMGLARHLGEADLSAIPASGGATYFTVADWRVVRYADDVGLGLALLAALLLLVVLVRDARQRRRRVVRVLGETSAALGVFLGVGLVSGLAWSWAAGVRDRPGVLESYAYLTVLLAVFGGAGAYLLRSRRTDALRPAGIAVVWASLAVLTAFLAPGFAYLFAWPALAAALLLAVSTGRARARRWTESLAGLGVAAAVLLLHIPFVDFVFLFAQPRPGNPDSQALPLAGLAVGLATLSIAQIHQGLRPASISPEA